MIFINGYAIDVAVTEEHSMANDVTEHPVEKGPNIGDHVRQRPDTLTIEGVVSDTPVGPIRDVREAVADGAIPSREAYAKLREFRALKTLLRITTSLRDYDDMVVESISVPRDSKTSSSLRFRATFKQVIQVETDRTTVRIEEPRAKKKSNKGTVPAKVPPKDAPPPSATTERYRSSWKALQDGAKQLVSD